MPDLPVTQNSEDVARILDAVDIANRVFGSLTKQGWSDEAAMQQVVFDLYATTLLVPGDIAEDAWKYRDLNK